jgi:hypothetical protein
VPVRRGRARRPSTPCGPCWPSSRRVLRPAAGRSIAPARIVKNKSGSKKKGRKINILSGSCGQEKRTLWAAQVEHVRPGRPRMTGLRRPQIPAVPAVVRDAELPLTGAGRVEVPTVPVVRAGRSFSGTRPCRSGSESLASALKPCGSYSERSTASKTRGGVPCIGSVLPSRLRIANAPGSAHPAVRRPLPVYPGGVRNRPVIPRSR